MLCACTTLIMSCDDDDDDNIGAWEMNKWRFQTDQSQIMRLNYQTAAHLLIHLPSAETAETLRPTVGSFSPHCKHWILKVSNQWIVYSSSTSNFYIKTNIDNTNVLGIILGFSSTCQSFQSYSMLGRVLITKLWGFVGAKLCATNRKKHFTKIWQI